MKSRGESRRNQRKRVDNYAKAAGRECGPCSVCCNLLAIPTLFKHAGQDCKHLRTGRNDKACARYETRPNVCAEFWCLWRLNLLPGFERPDQSGIVFTLRQEEGLIWAEGHALNVETFLEHHAQLDNLAKLTGHPIVLRTPNSSMVHCLGPLEAVERIRDLFGKKVAKEKRLPILRNEPEKS